MKKVLLALVLSLVIGSTAHASPDYENKIAMANARLVEIEDLLEKSNVGLYNTLDMLNYVYEYTIWTSFIVNGYGEFISDAELKYYYSSYANFINNYNNKFGTYLNLKVPKPSKGSYGIQSWKIVYKTIPNFVKTNLKEIQTEYDKFSSETEKLKYLSKQSILLSRVSQLYYTYGDIITEAEKLSPNSFFPVKEGDKSNAELKKALSFVTEKYKVLLDKGNEVTSNPESIGEIFVDPNKTFKDNLYGGTGVLSLAYLNALASSSVYVPFKSYTGSTEFMNTMLSSVEESQKDNVTVLYNNSKNLVKPLYKREIDVTGNLTGEARLLTLKDFINDIKKEKDGALVTIKGEFKLDPETQNWVYANENLFYAHDEITDESIMSKPLLMYSNQYLRSIDNLTFMILTNIIENTSNLKSLEDVGNRYLFINAYGDIVTDNNLVILPGIANPIIYKNESLYNPYSVAFMNSYPALSMTTDEFSTTSKTDIGKYTILQSIEDNNNSLAKAFKIGSKNSVNTNSYIRIPKMYTKFYANDQEYNDMLRQIRVRFGNEKDWNEEHALYEYKPYTIVQSNLIGSSSIFPYNPVEDSLYVISTVIARNMYRYLTNDEISDVKTNIGLLNDEYIGEYILSYGLQGTINPIGYTKDKKLDYDNIVNNKMNNFENTLSFMTDSIMDSLGDSKGIMGIGNFYADSIFGRVFVFIQEQIGLVAILVIILVMISFIRYFRGVFDSIVIVTASLGIMMVFIIILPSYLPYVYNFFLNNLSESLAYRTLMTVTEENASTMTNSLIQIGDDGRYVFNTNSLTLYKAGVKEKNEFREEIDASVSEVTSGNIKIINQRAGIFAEDDSFKVNTDILLHSLKISSKIKNTNIGQVYQFNSTKTVSNNIDYYTPYYQIVDAFIAKLNKVIEVYNVPRKLTTYSNGVVKENYAVYSYVNSAPFLTPGEYSINYLSDNTALDEETVYYFSELEKTLTTEFGDNVDFLGLAYFLYYDYQEYTDTLWWKTLQQNGYYDENNKPIAEKIDELISYVNYHTRKFIFDNIDAIGVVSDDTMIKIISLKALMLLSNEASEITNFLYPYTMSYQDLKLDDVLKTILIDDYSRYKDLNSDLTKYVLDEHGWLNLIMLDISIVFLFLISKIFAVLTPILYLGLPVMLLIRLIGNTFMVDTLKGYFKSTLLLVLNNTIIVGSIILVNSLNNKLVGLYVLVGFGYMVLHNQRVLITLIVTDALSLGNSKINAKFLNVKDMIADKARNMGMPKGLRNPFKRNKKSYNTNYRSNSNNRLARYRNDQYDPYSYSRDTYNGMNRNRSNHAGYDTYEDDNDYSMNKRSNVMDNYDYLDDISAATTNERYGNFETVDNLYENNTDNSVDELDGML